ncbi:MAG: phosphatase PAP2 family protein [Nanoarchaeota archaeon]|nr:phosphatase PAP2 family protein [Nanoarchaeota archaeon]
MLNLWALITFIGEPLFWVILTASFTAVCALFHSRLWRVGLFLLIALVAAFMAVDVLKGVTDIPRPCQVCETPTMSACNPYCLPDQSFPSGHAAAATVVAALGIVLARRPSRWIFVLFPLLVGASRIALGVHTLPDVLGGVAVGVVLFLVTRALAKETYVSL